MAEPIQTKRCPLCKQTFPATTKYFYKDKTKKSGLMSYCKQCNQQYRKRYNQSHKAENKRRCKRYTQKHLPEIRQYQKRYKQTHQAEFQQYKKKHKMTLRGYLGYVWRAMLHRCNNPKHKRYKDWGGRGIKVKFACFEDFYNYVIKELKVDPRGLTIDRIDNDGHYEKGNIRFVTQAENNRNRFRKM